MTTPDTDPGASIGQPSARMLELLSRSIFARIMRALFRPTLRGIEHLPDDGQPYLLVANHSAGLGLAEIICFAILYAEAFGTTRPLAGFAHPIGFKVWPLTRAHKHLGTIPSTYEAAHDALERQVPILVFPGGDHETFRPIWQARRVDFGGRRGFLRIARAASVRVVPMGIKGSHYTAPVLWRAKWLAWLFVLPRLVGVKRWAITLLGVLGAFSISWLPLPWYLTALLLWVWLTSPLIFLPIIPWPIQYTIGAPILPEALFGEEMEDGEDVLERALVQVERAVQELALEE